MAFFEFPHTRTYDSDLGWIIKKVGELLECCDAMQEWKQQHTEEYDELKDLYDSIMSGKFPESVTAAFNSWMRNNAADLVGGMISLISFGLTDTGYFYAEIPEAWEEVTFNTTEYDIIIELQPEYGHLVLSY